MIFISLQRSAQPPAPQWELGLAGVFTAPVPRSAKLFVLFCCCADVSRSVVVRLPAALPLATHNPQRTAEEHRVYPLHQAGAGALPLLVSPHRNPGNRNLGSGKPRGPGFQHMFLYAGRLGWSSQLSCCCLPACDSQSTTPVTILRTPLHTPRCWASLADFPTSSSHSLAAFICRC